MFPINGGNVLWGGDVNSLSKHTLRTSPVFIPTTRPSAVGMDLWGAGANSSTIIPPDLTPPSPRTISIVLIGGGGGAAATWTVGFTQPIVYRNFTEIEAKSEERRFKTILSLYCSTHALSLSTVLTILVVDHADLFIFFFLKQPSVNHRS
uniref:Uncharacterized protein n=1 Tax=Nelumbo nucifera TaxID=4432 RepID=A0A822Y8B9_NELNU|nr:TPA_asm: hypothetical protein HUJ06_029279 [Nelumbo nucifera]